MPEVSEDRLDAAFARLVFANRIREQLDLKTPPRIGRNPQQDKKVKDLLAWGFDPVGQDAGGGSPGQSLGRSAWATFKIRNLLYGWHHDIFTQSLRVAFARAVTGPMNVTEVSGYAVSAEDEKVSVRISLLLYLMKQYEKATGLLVRRLKTGLPSPETRYWLSFFLKQMKEKEAEKILLQHESVDRATPSKRPRPPSNGQTGLRFAVVIPTMFDSEVFRSSIRSLLRSDFVGDIIVVEDGNEPERQCEAFCREVGVIYHKLASWGGILEALNSGIRPVADRTDIIVYAHNDVLWPETWFQRMRSAWGEVYESKKVSVISLGSYQIHRRSGDVLHDLFVRDRYDDLKWILSAMREVPELMDSVQDTRVRPGLRLFGLCRDPWMDWVPDLRMTTGRLSVASSFPVQVWRDIGEFDQDLIYGIDLQLQRYSMENRRWMLYMNNEPLVHMRSSDTRDLAPEKRAAFGEKLGQMQRLFQEKHGWGLEHYQNIYFGETTVIHQDEIENAVNDLAFDRIDFVFDEFQQRLQERKRANCEMSWCRARPQCQYV
jgi:glycosyltransferase involved in cell wall biosynthesis